MTTGSEAERAITSDVSSGRQARLRISALTNLLTLLNSAKVIYAADWGIAYDLQRAEQLIEREMRALSCAEEKEEDGGGSRCFAAITE